MKYLILITLIIAGLAHADQPVSPMAYVISQQSPLEQGQSVIDGVPVHPTYQQVLTSGRIVYDLCNAPSADVAGSDAAFICIAATVYDEKINAAYTYDKQSPPVVACVHQYELDKIDSESSGLNIDQPVEKAKADPQIMCAGDKTVQQLRDEAIMNKALAK